MLKAMVPAGTPIARATVSSGPASSRWSAGMPAAPPCSRSPTQPNPHSPSRYLAVAAGGRRAEFTLSNWSTSTRGGSTIAVTLNVEYPAGASVPVRRFNRMNW